MDRILVFDLCSVIIEVILIISLLLRKMTSDRNNVIFILLSSVILTSGILDILRICYPRWVNPSSFHYFVISLITFVYFIVRQLTPVIYVLFLIAISGKWPDFQKGIFYKIFFILSVSFIFLVYIINLFVPIVYYFTPDLQYHRGKYMVILYVYSILVMVYATVFLSINKKMLVGHKVFLLFSIFPISVLGAILQLIYFKIAIEIFTTTIPLVIVSLFVLQPEDYLDFARGSFNLIACERLFNQNLLSKRKMTLIFFKILNGSDIRQQIGNDSYSLLIQGVTKKINFLKKYMDTDLFCIEEDGFLLISLETKESIVNNYVHEFDELIKGIDKIEKSSEKLDYLISYARCPQDFNRYDQILNYGLRFDSLIHKKNQAVSYSSEAQNIFFVLQCNLDEILKQAIVNQTFEMYYQPIYSISEKRFASAEALIRLVDNKFGFIPPSFFIPVAENTGAIHQIGDLVIQNVFRFLAEREEDLVGIDYIEINLSAEQCIEQELVSKIQQAAIKYGINTKKINLEITESASIFDSEVAEKNINDLKQLGFSLSLDDFGTGYSNLRRMAKLPVSIVKMDKAYVDERNNKDMDIIIKNTVSMFKKLNKKVLIEGVESKDDYNIFVDYGCDYVQGYYFSKPLPEKDFIAFLKRNNTGKNYD